jgi:hypothetical protein
VIIATSNTDNLLPSQTELTGNESATCGTSYNTAGKLTLLTSTPGEAFAILGDSKDVVSSTGDASNVLKLWDEQWGRLDFDILTET